MNKIMLSVPIGTVLDYAGSVPPDGYLECDGRAVSREEYAILFSVIGTTWGAGDGSTTFNLPNLGGRVCIGQGTRSVGDTGGSETHKLTVSEMPGHVHSVGAHNHSLGSHVHSVGAHKHGLGSHVHSVGAHKHGLGSHVHTVGAHNHGLNEHTHTLSSHTHDMNDHTHTTVMGKHKHDAAITATTNFAAGTNRGGYQSGTGSKYTGETDLGSKTSGGPSTANTKGPSTNTSGKASGNTANSTAFNSGAASGNTDDSTAFNSGAASGNTSDSTAFNSGPASGNTDDSTAFNSSSTGSGTSHSIMQPYAVIQKIIRAA